MILEKLIALLIYHILLFHPFNIIYLWYIYYCILCFVCRFF